MIIRNCIASEDYYYSNDMIKQIVNNNYNKLKININGFRNGKIKPELLYKKLGEIKYVTLILNQLLIPMAIEEFKKECTNELISEPKCINIEYEKDDYIKFELNSEVFPKINISFEDIKVKPIKTEILDEDITNFMKTFNKIETKKINKVDLDCDDIIVELKFNNTIMTINIGCNEVPIEFECNLMDKEVGYTFEFNDEQYTIINIYENIIINDIDFETAKNEYEKIIEEKDFSLNITNILDNIIENNYIQIPKSILEKRIDEMVYNYKHSMDDFEKYLEETQQTENDIRYEFKDEAKKQVQYEMIIKYIIKNILNDKIVNYNEQYNSALNWLYNKFIGENKLNKNGK